MNAPATVYVVRQHTGYYNPFFGSQKTAKTASKYWTRQEAQERAEKVGGEVVAIRRI